MFAQCERQLLINIYQELDVFQPSSSRKRNQCSLGLSQFINCKCQKSLYTFRPGIQGEMGETNILFSLKQREKHKLRLLPTLESPGGNYGFSGVIETLQITGLNLKFRFCRKCVNKGIYPYAIFLNSSPQPPFHRVSLRAVTVGIRAAIYPFLTKEKIRKETKIAGKYSLAQIPPYTPLS